MESPTLEGRIVTILGLQEGVSARGPWRKQEFVLETNEQYPKKVCICCWNEKIDELKNYQVNDSLKVGVNIESREFNNRWYTDVKAWRIEPLTQNPAPQQTESLPDAQDVVGMSFSDEDEELPF